MREIRVVGFAFFRFFGITPAYAGNTSCLFTVNLNGGDHPRVCGKYVSIELLTLVTLGSPPRMREIQDVCKLTTSSDGITPAYAGNTFIVYDFQPFYEDHPRVCGKY